MSPWDHIYWYGRGEDKKKQKQDTSGRGTGNWKKKSYKKWQLQTPLSTISNPWPGHTPSWYNNYMTLCYPRTAYFRLLFFHWKHFVSRAPGGQISLYLTLMLSLSLVGHNSMGRPSKEFYTITIPFQNNPANQWHTTKQLFESLS